MAAQILFETFNVPALYTSIQAVLSLYASGRTTGLVLDAGDGVSHAVPVYEGFAMGSSIRRIDIAGRDVTEHLQMLLRKAGHVFHTSAEKEVVRAMKEKVGYVALDPRKEEKEWSQLGAKTEKSEEYALPDGRKIKVCGRGLPFSTQHRSLFYLTPARTLHFGSWLAHLESGADLYYDRSAPNAGRPPNSSSTLP